MKFWSRAILFTLLLTASLVSSHTATVVAQTESEPEEAEAPATFVPSEKLPADSAISFPVDI